MESNQILTIIIQAAIFIFSIVIHEVSHGAIAEQLGDPTARQAGRLTLNPFKHLDFFGSLIFPLMLFWVSNGKFFFGWAKPVPYNPFNLKNPKRDAGWVAAAGPLSNFIVALIFGFFLRAANFIGLAEQTALAPLFIFFELTIFINLALAVFNLTPLPILDGSKVLYAFLPDSWLKFQNSAELYGPFLLLIFLFFGFFNFLTPLIFFLFRLIVGDV